MWLLRLVQKCCKKKCNKCLTQYLIDPPTEYIFRSILKQNPAIDDLSNKISDEERKANKCTAENITTADDSSDNAYTIVNFEVPNWYRFNLFTIVLHLLAIALVQFWNEFLFEESHGCSTDQNFVCFPPFPNMSTPRLDCSDTSYLENNNITSIICYRFVFRLGTATGSALGTVTITALVINIINLIILGLLDAMFKCYLKKEKKSWCIACTSLILLIQAISSLIIIGVAIGLSFAQKPTTYTLETQITIFIKNIFIGYTIVIYGILFFPWFLFKTKDKHTCLSKFCCLPCQSEDFENKSLRQPSHKSQEIELQKRTEETILKEQLKQQQEQLHGQLLELKQQQEQLLELKQQQGQLLENKQQQEQLQGQLLELKQQQGQLLENKQQQEQLQGQLLELKQQQGQLLENKQQQEHTRTT